MRISDWSSDVCSSDLGVVARKVIDCGHPIGGGRSMTIAVQEEDDGREELDVARQAALFARKAHDVQVQVLELFSADRSEERRVGKECVSMCRSRWWPDH